jgi:hypothetical protein
VVGDKITMNEIALVKQSFSQFFSKKILLIALIPFIICWILVGSVYFTISNIDFDTVDNLNISIQKHEKYTQNGQIVENHYTEQYSGTDANDFYKGFMQDSTINKFISFFFSFLLVGFMSIFISVIITGFLSHKIIYTLDKEVQYNKYTYFSFFIEVIKSFIIASILFFILIPTYFIPLLNILTILLPSYYFFHKLLNYQVANILYTKQEYFKVYFLSKSTIRTKTTILFSISLVPFVSMLLCVFYVIYINNSYKNIES